MQQEKGKMEVVFLINREKKSIQIGRAFSQLGTDIQADCNKQAKQSRQLPLNPLQSTFSICDAALFYSYYSLCMSLESYIINSPEYDFCVNQDDNDQDDDDDRSVRFHLHVDRWINRMKRRKTEFHALTIFALTFKFKTCKK